MKKYFPIIISILLSSSIFFYLITPSSFFNFLPFAIHDNFFRNIVSEALFIIIFDLLCSVILFYVFYKVLKNKLL